ncbi:MAG: response regulator transcription factor [Actinobacteria bacterium]|jgi:DNA-binding NarL/FixJ family response regulator|nr:response regulator transcription factor [Micrococcales bacterium]MCB0905280.1 response regulator transcription factor [Actinomycetota bacterium]MCO5298589.1 response regulator transcription factor [Candidatus Nanopelagicales bacterium]MCB9429067.1 response regulator transcription factor [Actinomycetota bacterium]HPE11542.1 response regulator transcription factor [Actinomycetota bacterium]
MTSVLIVDDAPAVRDNLRRLVTGLPGVASVSLASSGDEAIARCTAERPDLVLLDVRMPGMNGLECARRLLHFDPAVRIVMLTAGDDPQAVATAVANGAAGYISKDATRLEMGLAIHHVGGGDRPHDPPPPQFRLSERETQVLAGMSRGMSNGEIGRELYLSEDTIKTHARRLFRKLRASDRAQAVAVGLRAGLIS